MVWFLFLLPFRRIGTINRQSELICLLLSVSGSASAKRHHHHHRSLKSSKTAVSNASHMVNNEDGELEKTPRTLFALVVFHLLFHWHNCPSVNEQTKQLFVSNRFFLFSLARERAKSVIRTKETPSHSFFETIESKVNDWALLLRWPSAWKSKVRIACRVFRHNCLRNEI